jgi:hypothetical protein
LKVREGNAAFRPEDIMGSMVFGTQPTARVDSGNISPLTTLHFHIGQGEPNLNTAQEARNSPAPFISPKQIKFSNFMGANTKLCPENVRCSLNYVIYIYICVCVCVCIIGRKARRKETMRKTKK